MPVEELGRRMSAEELMQWRAFEAVAGPLTVQERVDWAAARVSWVLASVNQARTTLEDFLPPWIQGQAPEPQEQSNEEMIAVVRAFQRKKRR